MEFKFEVCERDRGGVVTTTHALRTQPMAKKAKWAYLYVCTQEEIQTVSEGFFYSVVWLRCWGGHVLTNPITLTLTFLLPSEL